MASTATAASPATNAPSTTPGGSNRPQLKTSTTPSNSAAANVNRRSVQSPPLEGAQRYVSWPFSNIAFLKPILSYLDMSLHMIAPRSHIMWSCPVPSHEEPYCFFVQLYTLGTLLTLLLFASVEGTLHIKLGPKTPNQNINTMETQDRAPLALKRLV